MAKNLTKNEGTCAWCKKDIILPVYERGKVSWAASTAYQNCGENTGHVFHLKCKKEYVEWLKGKPWLNLGYDPDRPMF